MGRIPLTRLDWLNYYSRGLKQRAAGGSYRQWGCGRLKMGLSKAITYRGSFFSGDAFLGRCIRAGILYLVVALYQMPGTAYAAPFAYVTNAGAGSVSVIDMATNAVIATVTVGLTPEQVAITPNGAFAYVAKSDGSNPGSVSVIATATNTVVGSPIPVDVAPVGVAITPNGAFVYVANSGSNTVSVIATASNTVVATISVGSPSGPAGVAITPNGAFVYVSNFVSNTVSVIATATNTVVGSPIPVEERPDFLAVSLNGASVFVPNQNSKTVSVIATASNTVSATILVELNPTGVATTPPNIPTIPTLSDGALLFLLAAMAAVLALRIATRQASRPPRPPRAI